MHGRELPQPAVQLETKSSNKAELKQECLSMKKLSQYNTVSFATVWPTLINTFSNGTYNNYYINCLMYNFI